MRGRRRISEPRRWLSWGKRIGGGLGKSGPHIPQDVIPSRFRRSHRFHAAKKSL